MKKLTQLQQKFCDIILLMELAGKVHKRKAYELAGYKCRGKTAEQEASRILKKPQVKAYLVRARKKRAELVEKTDEQIIREYERLAFSCLTDFVDFDSTGAVVMSSRILSEDVKPALKSIFVDEHSYINKKGKPGKNVRVKIDLHDKKGALDSLAKIKGLFVKSEKAVGQSFAKALHDALKE